MDTKESVIKKELLSKARTRYTQCIINDLKPSAVKELEGIRSDLDRGLVFSSRYRFNLLRANYFLGCEEVDVFQDFLGLSDSEYSKYLQLWESAELIELERELDANTVTIDSAWLLCVYRRFIK